jgi:hypothetical protein
VDERYLSQIEQSRTSARPLPLEVIENVQEAIWAGISGSVKAVLHRLEHQGFSARPDLRPGDDLWPAPQALAAHGRELAWLGARRGRGAAVRAGQGVGTR